MNILRTGLMVTGIWIIAAMPIMAQGTIQPEEKQIKAAVSPAPGDMRDGAKVLGYNRQGELATLREGSNELICLADDPKQDRFHVACYHKDLEPFMKRGRKLRAEGRSGEDVKNIRKEEILSGKIPMPRKPMALYSLTTSEDGYDYATGTVLHASPLYVVYVPFGTVESTGIAPKPISEGAPWLMNPGEPWAHIMISTGKEIGKDVNQE